MFNSLPPAPGLIPYPPIPLRRRLRELLARIGVLRITVVTLVVTLGLGLAVRPAYRQWRHFRAHQQLAQALELSGQGKHSAALPLFRAALNLLPNDGRVLRANARWHQQLKMPQARYFYEKLLALGLGTAEDQMELAEMLLNNGEHEVLASRLFGEKPVWKDLAAFLGRLEQARTPGDLSSVAAAGEGGEGGKDPVSPRAAARLLAIAGHYAMMQGDHAAGSARLRQSLAMDPANFQAVLSLGRLELLPRVLGTLRIEAASMDHADTVARLLDGLEGRAELTGDQGLQALGILCQMKGLSGELKQRAIQTIRQRPEACQAHHIQATAWELEDDFGRPSEGLLEKKLAAQAGLPLIERSALFALLEQRGRYSLILRGLDEESALSDCTLYMAALGAMVRLERFAEAEKWLNHPGRPKEPVRMALAHAMFAKLHGGGDAAVLTHLRNALAMGSAGTSPGAVLAMVPMAMSLEHPEIAREALELAARFDQTRAEALRIQEDMARSARVSAESLAVVYERIAREEPKNTSAQFLAAYYNLLISRDRVAWGKKAAQWQISMPDNSLAWVIAMIAGQDSPQTTAALLPRWSANSGKWRQTMSEGQLAVAAGLLAAAGRRDLALDLLPGISRQGLLQEERALLRLAVQW